MKQLYSVKAAMVVDDEEQICKMVKRFLESIFGGIIVITEGDPNEALRKLDARAYDLLITDNMMPGMTGLEVIKFLKVVEKNKKHFTRIVMMSGSVQNQHVLEAVNYGVRHILVKPFTKQQLEAKIDAAFAEQLPPFDIE